MTARPRDPSPAAIRRRCVVIRAGWSPAVARSRRVLLAAGLLFCLAWAADRPRTPARRRGRPPWFARMTLNAGRG